MRDNVAYQALMIADSSPVIARLIRERQLIIAGGVYDLQTSIVSPVLIPSV